MHVNKVNLHSARLFLITADRPEALIGILLSYGMTQRHINSCVNPTTTPQMDGIPSVFARVASENRKGKNTLCQKQCAQSHVIVVIICLGSGQMEVVSFCPHSGDVVKHTVESNLQETQVLV